MHMAQPALAEGGFAILASSRNIRGLKDSYRGCKENNMRLKSIL